MLVHLSYRRSVFINKTLELNLDAIGFIFEEACWILPHLQQPRSQWFLPNLICEWSSFSTVCFPTTCMINWQPFIFDTIIYVDFEFQILLDSKTNCKIIGTKVSLNQNSMQMIVIKIRARFFPPYYDLLIGWLTVLDFYLFYRKHIRCHSVHYHPIQSM